MNRYFDIGFALDQSGRRIWRHGSLSPVNLQACTQRRTGCRGLRIVIRRCHAYIVLFVCGITRKQRARVLLLFVDWRTYSSRSKSIMKSRQLTIVVPLVVAKFLSPVEKEIRYEMLQQKFDALLVLFVDSGLPFDMMNQQISGIVQYSLVFIRQYQMRTAISLTIAATLVTLLVPL